LHMLGTTGWMGCNADKAADAGFNHRDIGFSGRTHDKFSIAGGLDV
jgi:hypothetical protein